MDRPKTRRRRGFRLTSQGWQRLHEARKHLETDRNRANRYTLEDLSELTGFDPATVAKVLAAEEGVDKQTLLRFFTAFALELQPGDYTRPAALPEVTGVPPARRQDWGDAVDVSLFHGRGAELSTLERWVVAERCRLVVVLGMGGIGKTTLAIKLAYQVQADFDCLIWRSLRNAPGIEELLGELIQLLCARQPVDLPATVDLRISRLLECLRSTRCLLILDNAESLLRREEWAGTYREGYEVYRRLFERVAEVPHQSCLILTSREKPHEIASLEGATLPVRTLKLAGLPTEAGEAILSAKGLTGAGDGYRRLVESYRGNPLALKIVATSIQELFGGRVDEFFAQETVVFNGIRNLLEEQFERLSAFEKQVMYWLAINRERVSASQLREDMVPVATVSKLLEALESLLRRSLIEQRSTGAGDLVASFTQQPAVMEYTSERLIARIADEIESTEAVLFKSHALLKAQAKDYVRETQIRLILRPIADELLGRLGSHTHLENRLFAMLEEQRTRLPLEPGYLAGNALNLLCVLKSDLSDRDFSHLSVWQAGLQQTKLHRVNFSGSDLSRSAFVQTFGNFLFVRYSPDGQLLATADDSGEVRVWRVSDGQQLLSCKGHTDWICSLAFSPDGRTLASGSEDQTIKLWDVRTGQCLRTMRGHSGWVYTVAFAPDGYTLASGSPDRAVRLWDARTGESIRPLEGHDDWVYTVAFAPSSLILASGSGDRSVKLWEVASGRCLKTLRGHTGQIRSIDFAPDGRTLASASFDQTIRLWEVSSGRCLTTLRGHAGQVRAVAFSPDGQLLASGSGDQSVRLWDMGTRQCLRTLHGHSNWIWSLSFAPHGQTLATSGLDQSIRLWDVPSGQCLKLLQGHTSWAWSIVFSPDGSTLAGGSGDRTVKLWDIEANRCSATLSGHTGWVWSVAFSPDGQFLASGSFDETVRLWEVGAGQCIAVLEGHTGWIRSVVFAPDSRTLASSSHDRTVRLWEVDSGRQIAVLVGHTDWVHCAVFAPGGRLVASGSMDETVKLWDVETGQCLKTLEGHAGAVWFVAFSPDGSILASGSGDRTIKLWDVETDQGPRTLEGHTGSVWSVAFSPDGSTLVSSSHDRTARLWEVETGYCFRTLEGHTSQVCSAIFSPDGQAIATNSQDGSIRLWDRSTGECTQILRSERPYEGMKIAQVTGLTEAQKHVLKALGARE